MSLQSVFLFTDGACRGNPGPGGWGALLRYGKTEKSINGATVQTTNNQMELTAVIEGLKALKRPCQVELTTDSRYVLDGITKWLPKWKANGWKTAAKAPVKNADLWKQLDKEAQRHQIQWHWIKGHSGHPENEQADQLANLAIDQLLQQNSSTS